MSYKPAIVFRPLVALVLLAAMSALPAPTEAATYTVNVDDDTDDGTCDARHCSLREAINAANRNPGGDVIAFSLPGDAPHFIVLTGLLPDLTDDDTVVDATTQAGYSGVPLIRIQGQRMELAYAFRISGNGVSIRGFSLGGFGVAAAHPGGAAILVTYGTGANIAENYLGLNVDGTPLPNSYGVLVIPGAAVTTIANNVISANLSGGINSAGRGISILGNRIGTNPEGTASAGAQPIGVLIGGSAQGNAVGGIMAGQRNVISGNGQGVAIADGENHAVIGNYIGTDASGAEAVPNDIGLALGDLPLGALVHSNVISGNRGVGLEVRSSNSEIFSNWIGLTEAGTSALPNETGVVVYGDGNIFGASAPSGRGNVISGNSVGIRVYSSWNILQGNYIGTDIFGEAAVPNDTGILLDGGDRTYIDGGFGAGPNVISGNREVGLKISNGAEHTVVWSNNIGVGATGGAIPNGVGVEIENSQYSDIGGEGHGNTIRWNATGIGLYSGAVDNSIAFNVVAENTGQGLVLSGGTIEHNSFSANSFYDNGGLGIEFLEAGVNGGIEAPVLSDYRPGRGGSHAGGLTIRSCDGCTVELFVVDPDPTNHGEGKTFLYQAEGSTAGVVYPIPPGSPVDSCSQFTATATDGNGNTSEFSENVGPRLCLHVPPAGILLGIPGLAVVGGLAGWLGGRGTRRPWLPIGGGGLAGGLVGFVLIVVICRVPGIQVSLPGAPPQTETASEAPPPCAQFAGLLTPGHGARFDLGTDVLFELSPQPDPPGSQTLWTFLVSAPSGATGQKVSTSPRTTLSEAGLDPETSGLYSWSVSAERQDAQTKEWTPYCSGLPHRAFWIEPAGLTQTPAPLSAANGTTRQDANCRGGPSTQYPVLTHVARGTNLPIQGRNAGNTWWVVQLPTLQVPCWLSGDLLDTSGDLSVIPLIVAPPLPTPTPTEVPPRQPVQGCWVFNPQVQKNICVSPCPPNPQPGGSCTP